MEVNPGFTVGGITMEGDTTVGMIFAIISLATIAIGTAGNLIYALVAPKGQRLARIGRAFGLMLTGFAIALAGANSAPNGVETDGQMIAEAVIQVISAVLWTTGLKRWIPAA